MTSEQYLKKKLQHGSMQDYLEVDDVREYAIRFAIEQLKEVGFKMMEGLNSNEPLSSFFDDRIKELKSKLTL